MADEIIMATSNERNDLSKREPNTSQNDSGARSCRPYDAAAHRNPHESRPYFGRQEPEFGEGGPFGRQTDQPLLGPHMIQIGSRGPAVGQEHDRPEEKSNKSSAKQPNES